MFDIVIIGAGPAGLSAAIHAKRFDLNCVVLERGTVGGQALSARWIENYPGFPNGITGRDLMGLFVKQAEEVGVRIEKCEVSRVSLRGATTNVGATKQSPESNCVQGIASRPKVARNDNVYELVTSGGVVEANSIILATGLEPIRLPLPLGERAGGEGVLYYPDPNEVPHEGKNVVVIGGGDSAFDEALSFSKKAAHVTIAMRSDKPKAWDELIRQAKDADIEIMAGLSEECIAKLKADITIACCGKWQNLNILDEPLRMTSLPVASHQPLATLQLAGDIAHPNIRHIAAAVGDGVTAVEEISRGV